MKERISEYRGKRQVRWKTAADIKTIWTLLIVSWVLFFYPVFGTPKAQTC